MTRAEKARIRAKSWYQRNKVRGKKSRRAYYQKNKARMLKNSKAWYQANKEKEKEKRRTWYQENKEAVKSRARSWHAVNRPPGSYRDWYYPKKFGISFEKFLDLLQEQGEECPICCAKLQLSKKGADKAHLDHDHATGKIRGVLCLNCNTGLGRFRDDPELLLRAIGYLLNTT